MVKILTTVLSVYCRSKSYHTNFRFGLRLQSVDASAADKEVALSWAALADESVVSYSVYYDQGGAALPGATVNLTVSGPENTSISSGVSDASGNAEALWTTQSPNKKGVGGTANGSYTATVSGLSAPSHDWDGLAYKVDFTIGG